jgi:hypothetical protein
MIVAAATVVYTAFAGCQWKTMGGQLAQMRGEQRAWVLPYDDATRRDKLGSVYFDVLFKNTGRSPALRVRGLMAGANDLAQVPEWDRDPGGKGTILAPDAPYHMTTSAYPLSETDLATKWKNGVYLYGTLWYDDVYHQPHWTQFCDYTHGDLTQFQTCNKHGESDETQKSAAELR